MQDDHEQEKTQQDVITIVLTADNHLGYSAPGQHPRKREERRQRLRHAFQQATDFAVGQGVDLFVQAGDLFDTTKPDEQDRSFVATRLAQLRQAGVRTFALGGVHDTPVDTSSFLDEQADVSNLAPQVSYAYLGALHYFAPLVSTLRSYELEPVMVDVRGTVLGICGLGVLAGQEGDPLAQVHVASDIERAHIPLLVLHAPIEDLVTRLPSSSWLDMRAQVNRTTIAQQSTFRSILAGYHHGYQRLQIGESDVIVAGATQHIDFGDPDDEPGFVFLGLAADGIHWCRHIAIDSLQMRRLVIHTAELWPASAEDAHSTEGAGKQASTEGGASTAPTIIERLRPVASANTMVQLRLEGELTRGQYHQLDLGKVRRYGEEHCFSLAIDDMALSFLPEAVGAVLAPPSAHQAVLPGGQAMSPHEEGDLRRDERLSPREELMALADEWIAATHDAQERKALQATKEELLAALLRLA